MPTSVIDTADWRFVVPFRCPLALAGSRLLAKMTNRYGGPSVAAVDSEGGAITWTADANGLTTHLVILVPKAARGSWLASEATTLFFDVHRTLDGSSADEWLGRSSVLVLPASDSPLVQQRSGREAILTAAQPGAGVLLPALIPGPQLPPVPQIPLPVFDPVADEGVIFVLRVVGGVLVWVRVDALGPAAGTLNFSNPANSGLLALFPFGLPVTSATVVNGVLDFSNLDASGLLALLQLGTG